MCIIRFELSLDPGEMRFELGEPMPGEIAPEEAGDVVWEDEEDFCCSVLALAAVFACINFMKRVRGRGEHLLFYGQNK